jgi:phage tail protein X
MTAGSAAFYRSKDGDVVDAIAWRHYGRQDAGVVEAVFEANPGLADQGPILPAGLRIELPALPDPAPREGVRLWS